MIVIKVTSSSDGYIIEETCVEYVTRVEFSDLTHISSELVNSISYNYLE